MTIDELKKEVLSGHVYRKINDDGYAEGCLLPLYLLLPGMPRYKWIDDDMLNAVIDALDSLFNKISIDELKPGDILVFRMPFKKAHIGIYCGDGEMVHCTQNTNLEICQTSLFISRAEEVFR